MSPFLCLANDSAQGPKILQSTNAVSESGEERLLSLRHRREIQALLWTMIRRFPRLFEFSPFALFSFLSLATLSYLSATSFACIQFYKQDRFKRQIIEYLASGLYRFGNRPHGNCYWVESDRLMAGEYQGDKADAKARAKIQRTLDCGITFFLDLTEPGEYSLKRYDQILGAATVAWKQTNYQRIPIKDTSVPARSEMTQILDTIQNALAQGHVVYVHCWGGVGRTGTVVGCWLVRSGLSGQQALGQVARHWGAMSEEKRKRRPESPEFPSQHDFVRAWSEKPGS